MRLTKLALLCGVVMLAATATLARADEDADVAVPEIDADEGIDSGLEEVDEDISVEDAAGGKQPEMTEEQRAMVRHGHECSGRSCVLRWATAGAESTLRGHTMNVKRNSHRPRLASRCVRLRALTSRRK
jgi:hypothetical protein